MARTQPVQDGLAAAVRLVNLTEHEMAVEAQPLTGNGGDPDGTAPVSTLRIPPVGGFARVDDPGARLGDGWLNMPTGRVLLTRLRRSRHVIDPPAPAPGTKYLVSRLTAHAARHRTDLVFPLTEIRDGQGQVVGARGLGSYRRPLTLKERYRDWRAKSGERRSRRSLPGQWPTGVLFATGTALLSGALGLLPGVLDDISSNGWAAAGQAWTDWLTMAFLVLGAVVLGVAVRRWLTFMRKRGERGTAYVIEEQVGQRSASWPSRVYPVHYTGEYLAVPSLDLGSGSVPAERR